MDKKRARYAASLGLVAAMVAAAELLGEQEVVFPEIAALAAGMWVIDKQVWRIGRRQAVWLMTLAAAAGWLIARIPGLPPPGGIALGFLFAAGCQVLTRTSLAPMLSACLLPVALGADSPVYPVAVFLLTLTLSGGQLWMERRKLRTPLPPVFHLPRRRDECLVWLRMFAVLMLIAAGAALGAGFRRLLCVELGMPQAAAALAACACLFALFERYGRIFAPAGAVALIPLLIPARDLSVYPLQVAAGAAVLIAAGMLLGRRKRSAVSAVRTTQQQNAAGACF